MTAITELRQRPHLATFYRSLTSSSRTIEGDAQLSYRFDGEHPGWQRIFANRLQAQFFVRYANRFARTSDLLFVINSLNKVWTLNTGVNLTF